MNKDLLDKLDGAGEYYLSGFMSGNGVCERYANALVNLLDHVDLPEYDGGELYPCGDFNFYDGEKALRFHYSYPLSFFPEILESYPFITECERAEIVDTVDEFYKCGSAIAERRCLGGRGFNHFVPDYAGVLSHGLTQTEREALTAGGEFNDGLLRVIGAVKRLIERMKEKIAARPCPAGERLLSAYDSVPFLPANDFYEAVVCVNLVYRLDGCDSLGALDGYLQPYYEGKLDEARRLIRTLFEGADKTHCWSCILGGKGRYSELTDVCLKSIRGLASPNLSLKVSDDMPDRIWESALDAIAGGGGMPSLYNERMYIDGLIDAGVDEDDAKEFVLGGCTETMIAGDSNCGSIDAGINLAELLASVAEKSSATTYAEFLREYYCAIDEDIAGATSEVYADKAKKAESVPQFMRGMFTKRCASRGKSHNAGGVKYNFSVINVCGFANAVDSLAVLKTLCFDGGKYSINDAARVAKDGFTDGGFTRAAEKVARFGNDDGETDGIAADLSRHVFREISSYSSDDVKFFPASIMFSCYAEIGRRTRATFDLRKSGEPLADSGGAYQGRDTSGVTALLNSCLNVEQSLATGTWVVNVRLSPSCFRTDNARRAVRALIETYFAGGGMQLQINCVDQKTLQDAYSHPERHAGLVIRLGGYSDYYVRLDRSLQKSILERVENTI